MKQLLRKSFSALIFFSMLSHADDVANSSNTVKLKERPKAAISTIDPAGLNECSMKAATYDPVIKTALTMGHQIDFNRYLDRKYKGRIYKGEYLIEGTSFGPGKVTDFGEGPEMLTSCPSPAFIFKGVELLLVKPHFIKAPDGRCVLNPIYKDQDLIDKELPEWGISHAIKNLELRALVTESRIKTIEYIFSSKADAIKDYIFVKNRIKAEDYLNDEEFNVLKTSICACRKHQIAIDQIEDFKKEIIANKDFKIKTDNGDIRKMKKEDLECEFFGS